MRHEWWRNRSLPGVAAQHHTAGQHLSLFDQHWFLHQAPHLVPVGQWLCRRRWQPHCVAKVKRKKQSHHIKTIMLQLSHKIKTVMLRQHCQVMLKSPCYVRKKHHNTTVTSKQVMLKPSCYIHEVTRNQNCCSIKIIMLHQNSSYTQKLVLHQNITNNATSKAVLQSSHIVWKQYSYSQKLHQNGTIPSKQSWNSHEAILHANCSNQMVVTSKQCRYTHRVRSHQGGNVTSTASSK